MTQIPEINKITRKEFVEADAIYKIISYEITNTHVYFKLKGKKYYIGYPSSDLIKVDLQMVNKGKYLLVGVDLMVVVICMSTGRILFSMGLSSYFQGFEDINEASFKIFSELNDYIIGKTYFTVEKIIPHELEF